MRNKTRFEFVDELRKINCLERIVPIENLFPDDSEDSKADNNKFIRYREEHQHLNHPHNQDYLFNDIVSEYVHTAEAVCHDKFKAENEQISRDLHYYNNWSQSLNEQIKSRDYKFKFYFKDSLPPPRLKQQANKDKDKALTNQGQLGQKNQNDNNNQEETNLSLLPGGSKYNFYEITKYIEQNNLDKDDKETTFMRDLTIKSEILELRKLKNLSQIQQIDDFNEQFKKFTYYIQPQPDVLPIDFIDNSVIRQNSVLSFDYFRDIGTPSRNIKDYTIKHDNQIKTKDQDDEPNDIHNQYNQEKQELLYLYFLKEQELKINKAEMSFFDLANMSMGRITSRNAHMCVRSEKVTKAQYLKLLKKLQKYDLRQNQTGKAKNDKQTGTQQLQQINMQIKKQSDDDEKREYLNLQSLIDQINKIRKESKLLEQKNSLTRFNQPNFNHQIYTKLEGMLNTLFQMTTDKMHIKYGIHEIADHLEQIQGTNDASGERLKILWFVANCYNELMAKRSSKVDLRGIVYKPSKPDPLLSKYKGNKLIKEETIQPKQVYGFNNNKNKQVNHNKSTMIGDTISKTPTKTNHNQSTFTRTPTKYSNRKVTDKPQGSTTGKKFPLTAKK